MKKAIIKQTVQNRINEGMFRTRKFWFVLKADNGKIIDTSQQYTQKHNAIKILKKHHPEFEIVDTTVVKKTGVKKIHA
jgi:uncharacterized protein YegP (UPF0339 family)